MWALSLLAADDPLSRPELIFGVVGLVLALLAGAVAISLTDRWRRRAATPIHSETDMLTTYRDMFEHGEITEAEYTELRRKVAEKVKAAPVLPPAPAGPDPVTGRPDPARLAGAVAAAATTSPPPASAPPTPPAAPPEPPPPAGTA